jgi:hypothetical protein
MLVSGAVTLAALALAQDLAYRHARAATLDGAVEAELHRTSPRVLERLRRERDPIHARLRMARAIVSDALDPAALPFAPASLDNPEAAAARLQLARRLAEEARGEIPASWIAPMIEGAATYLQWSGTRDERLIREYQAWEEPLLESLELAPAHREPALFLAAAYLELWPVLADPKREQARELVSRAMREPLGLRRLLVPWLDRATNRQEAFAALPPQPEVWRQVLHHYAEDRRWNAFLEARERWQAAVESTAQEALAEAERRRRGGDLRGARELYLEAAATLPAEGASDATLDAIFQACPPGTTGSRFLSGLRHHLDRGLDLQLQGRSTLNPRTFARLTFAVDTGNRMPAHEAAFATLAAGDLPRAEALARRSASSFLALEWAPYLLIRARELIRRGELNEASRDLDRVHPAWTQRPVYWWTHLLLAQAQEDPSRARAALDRLHAGQEEGRDHRRADWRPRDDGHRLEWFARQDYTGFRLAFDAVPAGGAAVVVLLNGDPLGTFALRSGQRLNLSLESPVAAGEIHTLEVRPLAGGAVTPGRVVLRAAPLGAPPAPPHRSAPG